jgi:heparosan-N-sulfate-glucuronate 5-epimerase
LKARFYKLSRDVGSYIFSNQDFKFNEQSLKSFVYPVDLEFTLQNEAFFYEPKDENGLPIRVYHSVGRQYNPTRVAAFGLAHFNRFQTTGGDLSRQLFFKCADWFMKPSDGLWQYNFDWGDLKAPWISCMSQGEGISVLVRAFYLSGQVGYKQQAHRALEPLCLAIEEGGVRSTIEGQWPFLEEYPSAKPVHVLNGYLYALIGLYDFTKIDEAVAEKVGFRSLVETLRYKIKDWDVGYWSAYDLGESTSAVHNAVTVSYHRLHIAQLKFLGSVTHTPELLDIAKRWETYLANPLYRMRALVNKLNYRRVKPAQF